VDWRDGVSAAPIVVVVVNQAWTAWKFRMRLIESIRAAGYRVVLMAGRDDSFDRLALACDELIEIRMALRRISLAADLRTALDYVRHLKRLNPVAVLSFTIKPNIYASLACRCDQQRYWSRYGPAQWAASCLDRWPAVPRFV
jgi:Glycosyl transferase 4-like